jgi:hypothetical protein
MHRRTPSEQKRSREEGCESFRLEKMFSARSLSGPMRALAAASSRQQRQKACKFEQIFASVGKILWQNIAVSMWLKHVPQGPGA